jgi:kumamolisin
MPETHGVLPGTRRPVPAGARRVRDIDPNAHIEVTVTLKAPALPMPETSAEALTPAELARQYGAPLDNIRKVEETLRSYGLHIEGVGPTRRTLRVSGTASAMEAAFKAGVGIYQSAAQGEFRGREGSVSIPAEIADMVESVVGLDQRKVAQRKAGAQGHSAATPLGPSDLETHYNFPPGNGAHQKIAIAEFGAPLQSGSFLPPAFLPDDVEAFCKSQGRPVPTVTTVPVNLAPLTLDQLKSLPTQTANDVLDETGEVMMDVEIVATLGSAADISVYYATFDQKGWLDLVERVTADQPVALSVSYGLAEDSPEWEPVTSINGGAIQGRVIPDVAALAGPPLYQLTLLGQSSPNGGTSA